jgi:hypothetical protein
MRDGGRAGLNFADTHQRTNRYVQKATLPLVPGALRDTVGGTPAAPFCKS